MSDSENTAAAPAAPHPSFGGKSIESVQQQQRGERPAYKSWRKKYRKMRAAFDATLEENKVLFRQEHKLEGTAKRLREELDGILETLLEINQSAAIPPELRFDVRIPAQRERPNLVPEDIDPDGADHLMREYTNAVAHGRIPPLDLHIMREQIDERLAAQGVTPLEALEQSTPHPLIPSTEDDIPEECKGDSPPGYLTTDQESAYLQRLDEKFGDRLALDRIEHTPPSPHPAELTPRELERHMELLNPQSQHNWLKLNTKIHTEGAPPDDTESLASHEGAGGKTKGKGKGKNLAKQAAERAAGYEGYMSPSAASGFDEDELAVGMSEDQPGSGSGKKRVRDPDGAYRVKGGKGGGAAKGGKRKRTTEEGGAIKKAKVGEGLIEA